MKTTTVGREAEAAVAEYLSNNGFEILSKNWRTRWCEVDIIAKKARIVYFIEVKYRAYDSHGSGFAYITPHKLRQIEFATRFWTAQNSWDGDCRIAGAEVSGMEFEKVELVEIAQ